MHAHTDIAYFIKLHVATVCMHMSELKVAISHWPFSQDILHDNCIFPTIPIMA